MERSRKELLCPGRDIDLKSPSASNNKSYITYIFKNSNNEVVYVGRASGNGNPIQVMNGRLSRGHDHYKEGYTWEIVATQTNRYANLGAEEFFMQGYIELEVTLENVAPSVSYKTGRTKKTILKLDAFFEDLFN